MGRLNKGPWPGCHGRTSARMYRNTARYRTAGTDMHCCSVPRAAGPCATSNQLCVLLSSRRSTSSTTSSGPPPARRLCSRMRSAAWCAPARTATTCASSRTARRAAGRRSPCRGRRRTRVGSQAKQRHVPWVQLSWGACTLRDGAAERSPFAKPLAEPNAAPAL